MPLKIGTTNVSDINVRTTPNLFGLNNSLSNNGIALSYSNGAFTISGTNTINENLGMVQTLSLPTGTYTMSSQNTSGTSSADFRLVMHDSSWTWQRTVYFNRNSNASFTLSDTTNVYFDIYGPAANNTINCSGNFMLNIGSTALPYQPYNVVSLTAFNAKQGATITQVWGKRTFTATVSNYSYLSSLTYLYNDAGGYQQTNSFSSTTTFNNVGFDENITISATPISSTVQYSYSVSGIGTFTPSSSSTTVQGIRSTQVYTLYGECDNATVKFYSNSGLTTEITQASYGDTIYYKCIGNTGYQDKSGSLVVDTTQQGDYSFIFDYTTNHTASVDLGSVPLAARNLTAIFSNATATLNGNSITSGTAYQVGIGDSYTLVITTNNYHYFSSNAYSGILSGNTYLVRSASNLEGTTKYKTLTITGMVSSSDLTFDLTTYIVQAYYLYCTNTSYRNIYISSNNSTWSNAITTDYCYYESGSELYIKASCKYSTCGYYMSGIGMTGYMFNNTADVITVHTSSSSTSSYYQTKTTSSKVVFNGHKTLSITYTTLRILTISTNGTDCISNLNMGTSYWNNNVSVPSGYFSTDSEVHWSDSNIKSYKYVSSVSGTTYTTNTISERIYSSASSYSTYPINITIPSITMNGNKNITINCTDFNIVYIKPFQYPGAEIELTRPAITSNASIIFGYKNHSFNLGDIYIKSFEANEGFYVSFYKSTFLVKNLITNTSYYTDPRYAPSGYSTKVITGYEAYLGNSLVSPSTAEIIYGSNVIASYPSMFHNINFASRTISNNFKIGLYSATYEVSCIGFNNGEYSQSFRSTKISGYIPLYQYTIISSKCLMVIPVSKNFYHSGSDGNSIYLYFTDNDDGYSVYPYGTRLYKNESKEIQLSR